MKYNGITKDTLFLLSDNRFRDSREFYEEHKEELKAGITVPMRQIASIIGQELLPLDELMNVNPVKMVSRIFRDTRYTKDKRLYRDNMWIMFMRDKHQWQCYPCFWFEVTPSEYSMGIGFFGSEPGLMTTFRKHIRENPFEFKEIAENCESVGGKLYGEEYKRMPADCPEGMERYWCKKQFGFIFESQNTDDLKDEGIIDIIREKFDKFSLLYTFMLKISDEYFSRGE